MNRPALTAVVAAATLGAGCAVTPPYNPFKVSRPEILSRVKTVAVATVRLPDDLSEREQLRAEFQTMIADELKAQGFQVVPAAEYEKIFTRLRDEIGGFYDPKTGKADEQKIKTVQDLCLRELAATFHADAVLYPAITVVSARILGQTALWDKVSENCIAGGFWQRFAAGGFQGTIPALSLWVWLKDVRGDDLYANGGGLQLISKITGAGRFVGVPITDLLVDPQIKSRSVQIAFAPLRGETLDEPARNVPELKRPRATSR